MKNQDTIGRALLAMFAFAVLANCAKADIESAQEHQGTGRVVIHDPEAEMGHGNPLFKWMIVSPDGSKAFANDFTTNAISVVTEDGTNYYAHVQGENNDRTKVIHFTVDKDGFPSSQGDLIDTTLSGETNNVARMQRRELVATMDGYLFFYSTDNCVTSTNDWVSPLIYNPMVENSWVKDCTLAQKCLVTCQNGPELCFVNRTIYKTQQTDRGYELEHVALLTLSYAPAPCGSRLGEYNVMTVKNNPDTSSWDYYFGDSLGKVYKKKGNRRYDEIAQLPGPISGLSNNGEEIFATTESTNAFYNVTFEGYNVVKDENGHLKSMVPPTKEGLLRVIDNRKKGGKFLYVTRKGILSIEE